MTYKCRLAVLLAERKLRMVDLVAITGVAFHTVRRYYHDEDMKLIDLEVVAKFCKALDCDIGDMFVLKEQSQQ